LTSSGYTNEDINKINTQINETVSQGFDDVKSLKLSLQNDIGDLLYEEKKLVNNNLNLILNFEKKITDKIKSIWSN
jgi:hypothetical protein